jgi:tRNA-2-methylthio-N6-dimethylallyladenosine synthase
MKYYVLTLGCQMNISDSQRIATKLDEIGYKSAPEKEADLVVVNACSVRQHAVDRVWGGIKKWQAEGKKILITGCVLPSDKKKFTNRNIISFDIKNLNSLDKILSNNASPRNCYSNFGATKDEQADYFQIKPDLKGKIAYIPIMTGCDNFCSYCAVPYTRGREVSRPVDDILLEVKNALAEGFKEIWLLGQNVNSYKTAHRSPSTADRKDNKDFIILLKTIDDLPGDFKFNFMSSNPHDMGDELIDCFAELKKWTKELHLAMQSGDDEILRKMNRKYTSGQFLALISKLKSQISDLKLSTDIIVGFPGETKTQFQHTLEVCLKVGFWKAFIGQYSPRPGTVSAKMPDDVPAEEKKRRFQALDKLINHN